MKKFKKGETVYSIRKGKGKVINVSNADGYPILVKFNSSSSIYTKDGKLTTADLYPELYHKPVKIIKKKNHKSVKVPMIEDIIVIHSRAKLTLSFKQFLVDNGIDWNRFVDNCKIENQRWDVSYLYYTCGINKLSRLNFEDWIRRAFSWKHSICSTIDKLDNLDDKWLEVVSEYKANNWEIVFE